MSRFGSPFKPLMWSIALLAAVAAGCGGGDGGNDYGNTGAVCAGAGCVSLGQASRFVILSKSGISTVPNSAITGNLGASPIAATGITGFSLVADASNRFSRSAQVTGKVFAADYASPTPSDLTTAVHNMETAYTDAAGRTPGIGNTNLGAGTIGGLSFPPGVYKWTSNVSIPTDITLAGTGSASDVWIFQISGNLTQAAATNVNLLGGAVARNIFWQVAGFVTIGTTAHFEGIALVQTAITVDTNASWTGRLMAQTAVNLDQNVVVQPDQ